MAKTKKKRVSARAKAKAPTTATVPDGLQLFTVHLLNPPSEHTVAATDEEDAAERLCSRWEMNVDRVKVVRQSDGRVFEVHGKLDGGDWCSEGSEEIVAPPPAPPTPPIGSATGSDLQCSFCGKTQREVKHLIAGPTVYICDECIALSVEICLEKDVDVVTPAMTNLEKDRELEAQTDEQKKAAAEKKIAEERTRLTDVAEAVLAALRNDKHEDAKKRLVDLARALGDDLFTQAETTKLLALAKDAYEAKMSIGVYVEEVKRRIAIYERAVKAKSLWGMAGMDMLAAAVGGMGMAYMMSKFGREPKTP